MSGYKLRLIFIIFITAFFFTTFGQLNEIRLFHDRIDSFTIENGLSHNNIKCITQDPFGFIWLGTESGLNRFNGYEFINYSQEIKNYYKPGHSMIQNIFVNHDSLLYISTWGDGVYIFSPKKKQFSSLEESLWSDSLNMHDHISFIQKNRDDSYWIGTLAGLYLLNPSKKILKHYYHISNDSSSLSSDRVNKFIKPENREPVFLTNDGTLHIFNPHRDSFKKIRTTHPYIPTKSPNIKSLHIFNRDNILLGTESGVYIYSYTHDTTFPVRIINKTTGQELKPFVTSFLQVNKELLWIGTRENGILEVETQTTLFPPFELPLNTRALKNVMISVLFRDRQGNVWVGTENNGIRVIYNKNKKFHFLDFDNNPVQCIAAQNDSIYWIGTNDGLFQYNRTNNNFHSWTHEDGLSSGNIRSLLFSGKDSLLLGTQQGVNLLNTKNGKIRTFHKENPFLTSPVVCIKKDKKGNLWLGSDREGLLLVDHITNKIEKYTPSSSIPNIGNTNVTSLCIDKKNQLWVGIYGGGINLFNPKIKKFEKRFLANPEDSTSLNDNNIIDIYLSRDNKIWISTLNGGINLFDPESCSFQHITTSQGLPTNNMAAIIQDSEEKMWISSSKGIVRYNPISKEMNIFNKSDGLLSDLFISKSVCLASDGTLLFGNSKGINYFQPDEVNQNIIPPELVITDLKINNKSIQPGKANSPLRTDISTTTSITLKHNETVISIAFVALNYISPEKNQYAYKMDGLEKEWVYIGNQRNAYYSNLPSGNYTFLLKASNNDKYWTSEMKKLKIEVLPPPWKSPWAYTVYIFLFLSLNIFVIWLIRWVLQRKHELELIRVERDKEKQVAHFKLQFFTNISHELRTHLTLINSPVHKLLHKKQSQDNKKNLELIQLNVNRLIRLTEEIMDFRKIEQGKIPLILHKLELISYLKEIKELYNPVAEDYNIEYTFESEFEELTGCFDSEKLKKILFNLLSNAFKYTPNQGKICLYIIKEAAPNDTDKSFFRIGVRDNGIGIPSKHLSHIFDRFFNPGSDVIPHEKNESSGIGLAIVKQLVEMHGGTISVNSSPGKGSDFYFSLNRLSCVKESAPEPSITAVIKPVDSEQWEKILDIERDKIHASPSAIEIPKSKELKTILLVDDNPEILENINGFLGKQYNIIKAKHGKEAIQLCETHNPDLILSDIMMPVMDGINLCNHIKTDIKFSHIPVVLLTAKTGDENELEGLKNGADAYLQKPYNPEKLLLTIINILSSTDNLHRYFLNDKKTIETPPQLNPLDRKLIQNIEKIIRENLTTSELNVDHIAREAGLSRMHLYRKIKAITGQTPNEYIKGIKLHHAKELLTNSELSIAEVAWESGFSSPGNFSTSFKAYFGKTPAKYRDKLYR